MKKWGLIGAGVGLGVAMLWAMTPSCAKASTGRAPARSGARRRVDVRDLAERAGLPSEWGDFLAMVAHTESGRRPEAVNDSASEAAKSEQGYQRIADRFSKCDHPDEAYTWGSGGLFGHMPAFAFSQFKRGRCLPPERLLEPEVSLAAAVGFANGLMGWPRYKATPTWLNLRAMWGAPFKGSNAQYLAARRPDYERHAKAVGIPVSFLDQTPPALRVTGDEVLEHFGVL